MKKKWLLVLIVLCAFCLTAGLAACRRTPAEPQDETVLTLKKENNSFEIDIYQITYVAVDLPSLFNETVSGLSYETTAGSTHLTLGKVSSAGKMNVISDGTVGNYDVSVTVKKDGEQVLEFTLKINVVDNAPAPTVVKNIENVSLDAPVFPNGAAGETQVEYSLDLSQYFDAASNVTYEAVCEDATVKMTSDAAKPYLVTLSFGAVGEKDVTIYAVQRGNRTVSSTFKVTLTAKTPNQLINGDFEQGLTGWKLDAWAKAAYGINDSNVDIWGNGVDNDGHYLYGYYDEAATCEFNSSLFTLSGSGYITWKMAGNSAEELQFKLMKYVADGDDVEIARFNNWYYGVYKQSGFIFRQYYYQAAEEYLGSQCYFQVIDNLSAEFAFVNLDSIRTYYSSAPNTSLMYRAGYCKDPSGVVLDMSDTSGVPFPSDLSTVGYQLVNGDFEDGYTGWYMTEAEKKAYGIYGSKTDIWNNPVNATNNYLYGYQQESFASANFHSSLFKVGGTGLITWKMAGNSTEDLQFVLMKYNPDGDDEEIAKFNNWYFPISQESGFIFRNYKYEIDLDEYAGSYCYFVVKDYRNADFGFICLDDIVTYYETEPTLEGTWYDAGFATDPNA